MSEVKEEPNTNDPGPPKKKTVRRVITKVKAEVSHAPYVLRDTPDICVIMIDSPDVARYKPSELKEEDKEELVEQRVEEEVLDIKVPDSEYYDQSQEYTQGGVSVPTTTVDWLPLEFVLTEVSGEYICGYVKKEEDVDAVLKAHTKYTESFFSFNSDDRYRKKRQSRRLFYYNRLLNLSSHISSNDRNMIYVCSYGLKSRTKDREEAHCVYTKVIMKEGQPVRRGIDCPAKIIVNELSVYYDYMLDGLKKKQKLERMRDLKNLLAQDGEVFAEKYYHLKLPLKEAHRGHIVSDYHWKMSRTHPRLLKKMEELIVCGLRNVKIIQAILKKFAEEELIEGSIADVKNLNYYFPTDKTIRNKMRFVTVKYNLKDGQGADSKKKKGEKLPPKKRKREKEKDTREFYQYEDYKIQ